MRSYEKRSSGIIEEMNKEKKPVVPIDRKKSQQNMM